MERLWSPWRLAYVTSTSKPPDGCIFCAVSAPGAGNQGDPQRDGLVLAHGRDCYVILNLYPYNNGHLMVVPREHTADLMALSAEAYQGTCELLRQSVALVKQELGAHGVNLGMNLGRVAGAGIDQHCHFHVVPRWNGDTNFMPVVGDVKVLSEHVLGTYQRLRPAFQKLHAPG